jgi:cytochrome P450
MEEKEQYFAALNRGEDVSSLLINGLPFTTRMVYETTRLCMKGLAPRLATEEMNIADKFVIPKGFYLMFPYELASHNGGIYSSPLSHNPDRFLTEGKEPFQNIGFGAGRHPCIGAKFALMNIKTLVFSFLDRFDAKLQDDVYNLIPKTQVIGVFRPAKPCMVTLTQKAN